MVEPTRGSKFQPLPFGSKFLQTDCPSSHPLWDQQSSILGPTVLQTLAQPSSNCCRRAACQTCGRGAWKPLLLMADARKKLFQAPHGRFLTPASKRRRPRRGGATRSGHPGQRSYDDGSLDALRLTQFVLTSNSLARGNETTLLQTPTLNVETATFQPVGPRWASELQSSQLQSFHTPFAMAKSALN